LVPTAGQEGIGVDLAAVPGPDEPVQIGAGTGPAVIVVPTDEAAEVARQARSVLLDVRAERPR
jgi:hypothetical protein